MEFVHSHASYICLVFKNIYTASHGLPSTTLLRVSASLKRRNAEAIAVCSALAIAVANLDTDCNVQAVGSAQPSRRQTLRSRVPSSSVLLTIVDGMAHVAFTFRWRRDGTCSTVDARCLTGCSGRRGQSRCRGRSRLADDGVIAGRHSSMIGIACLGIDLVAVYSRSTLVRFLLRR